MICRSQTKPHKFSRMPHSVIYEPYNFYFGPYDFSAGRKIFLGLHNFSTCSGSFLETSTIYFMIPTIFLFWVLQFSWRVYSFPQATLFFHRPQGTSIGCTIFLRALKVLSETSTIYFVSPTIFIWGPTIFLYAVQFSSGPNIFPQAPQSFYRP